MLYAYNLTTQILTPNKPTVFATNGINDNCSISHTEGDSEVILSKCGQYIVTVNLDATSDTSGSLNFQLMNKGKVVLGAEATNTVNIPCVIHNCSFTAALRVPPSCPAVNNAAVLTVNNLGPNTAQVSNAAITVRKI